MKGFKSTDIRAIKVPDVFTPVISFGKDAQAPRKDQAFNKLFLNLLSNLVLDLVAFLCANNDEVGGLLGNRK